MKKVLTLAAALLVIGASSAMAQSGLNLFWGGCSDGGASALTFNCASNSGTAGTLVGTVVLPGAMPTFTGLTAVVDVAVDAPSLPAWWLTNTGECRANAIAISFDPNNNASNCFTDAWGGTNPTAVSAIQPGIHGPNWVRVNGAAALAAGSEISLPADGTEYYVFRVTISRAKSTGTGSCAGCNVGACIVLNEIKLSQPLGIGDRTVTNPATSNFAVWQGGLAQCPIPTPAQNRTWGAVKNLYR